MVAGPADCRAEVRTPSPGPHSSWIRGVRGQQWQDSVGRAPVPQAQMLHVYSPPELGGSVGEQGTPRAGCGWREDSLSIMAPHTPGPSPAAPHVSLLGGLTPNFCWLWPAPPRLPGIVFLDRKRSSEVRPEKKQALYQTSYEIHFSPPAGATASPPFAYNFSKGGSMAGATPTLKRTPRKRGRKRPPPQAWLLPTSSRGPWGGVAGAHSHSSPPALGAGRDLPQWHRAEERGVPTIATASLVHSPPGGIGQLSALRPRAQSSRSRLQRLETGGGGPALITPKGRAAAGAGRRGGRCQAHPSPSG